ncbi:MAG: prenyltransferase [Chloroflexi bacterium]|nr:MAG: prenyltransferase [Chloroflexota bacterium]
MTATTAQTKPKPNLKTIALPASHGGWGFLFEPILLGLLVAPSMAALWLGVAASGAFLSQQPLKLALTDRRKGRRYPRSIWAERLAALYLAVAAAGLVLAWASSPFAFWLPLLLAVPLAAVQLYYDARNRGRELIPELFGAGALGAVASAAAMAAGWSAGPALALWVILFARTVGSVVYVRARLRLERGQKIRRLPVTLTHLLAALIIAGLAVAGLAPWLAVAALLVLLGRSLFGLSAQRRVVKPKIVGFQEMAYGLLTVLLTTIGYFLQI